MSAALPVAAPLVVYGWIKPLIARSGVLRFLPARVRALAQLAPPITLKSLTASTAEVTPAAGARRMRVGFLTGCVQRLAFAQVNEATVRVLAAEGCEVVAPGSQGCCGALALHAGREEEARTFAQRAIELFEQAGVERIVVNAAGCGSSMKEYERLFAGDAEWSVRARAFSARVRDVNELLIELGEARATRHPLNLRVAYHDACHLAHAQRVTSQPRQLLAAIPNLQLVEIPEGELCCGSAGTYNLEQPELAAQIGERKAKNVLLTGAQAVATGNIGCMTQIQTHLQTLGQPLPVWHTLEVLDRAYAQGKN